MKRTWIAGMVLVIATVLMAGCTGAATGPTQGPPTATPHGEMLPRVAAFASTETAFDASQVIDGFPNSRWSSEEGDEQWVYVDLGDTYSITRVIIRWYWPPIDTNPPTYALVYDIQVSDDAETWTTIAGLTDGDGLDDDFTGLSATGRYVRMYATEPAPGTGRRYSIKEFEVYGEAGQ